MKRFIFFGREINVLYLHMKENPPNYDDGYSEENIVWKTVREKGNYPIYRGDVENGKPNGFGICKYTPSGMKYVGSWKNGEFHGKGKLTFPWGEKYVGEFKNRNKHGQGTMTRGNYLWGFRKSVGEWKDSELWTGITYGRFGRIRFKRVNGKYLVFDGIKKE